MDIQLYCSCQEYTYAPIFGALTRKRLIRLASVEHTVCDVEQPITLPATVNATGWVWLQAGNASHKDIQWDEIFSDHFVQLEGNKQVYYLLLSGFIWGTQNMQGVLCGIFCSCSPRWAPDQRKQKRRKIQLTENSIKQFSSNRGLFPVL